MQGSPNMEIIMVQIKEHLLETIDSGANGNTHHYNRVWEKIEKWAKENDTCCCHSHGSASACLYFDSGRCSHPLRCS